MKYKLFSLTLAFGLFGNVSAQETKKNSDEILVKLSNLPLHCIRCEYPNKTGHTINEEKDATLTPSQLHPVFYGCFDWHSSVHGHWMLVRLIKTRPNISNYQEIVKLLDESFNLEKIEAEARYFDKYKGANVFERTYGWAWLLKLDEELVTWDNPLGKQWHEKLQPLTQKIVSLWRDYLPKQTYPNRVGTHPNTAFALGFAIDWARATSNSVFEQELIQKSKQLFLKDSLIPAHLEPDGADFFSPSLETADLMSRVLPQKEYVKWLNQFFDKRGVENIIKAPIISDMKDYQIVHLVGLSFSKSWCMKRISKALPKNHPLKEKFKVASKELLSNGLPLIFESDYGGDHWLASFALMAMEE
ncbi:DUF2891 domain-containing protein [Riemerella anatipestifer]|uniref:DUF2891 domain-containing protein n=1 Tax=Riemerella anatipestifer RA-CH-1 TaxID=1228997 RepID=J9R2K8_RIEAN|nr:DUF2891 domain-containing protein [Riemerella anatipestifer]AFR36074.1 hypothetical protein B739_1481 [Riemerella anatipestifer RA-CH-1]AIH03073.1 hypothetical protein M949_1906 [Riemerella anatipestifer CH3]MBT0549432.1 DUF2891 domain-containing protein [Riemerella anatipestifer]MBT0556665.1 DUF2891 domain-containing protein [Riemerella anatipestifer]MBT0560195.1 DUF2891 domain-containing protein [Riemerella anatipestifer]